MTNIHDSNNIFLIDSNIILDVLFQHNSHSEWATEVLIKCADKGTLAINQIIFAEISCLFPDIYELESALYDYQKLSLPWEAGFLASKAFLAYRKNGGKRQTLMPDFYIGAHATFCGFTLVSRDRGYTHYFPKLNVIVPK